MGLLDRLLGRPTMDRFAAALIAALRAAGDPDDLHYDAAGGRILRLKDGEPGGVINLGNLFHAYCDTPRAGRLEALGHFVRAALAHLRKIPDDYEAARPDVQARLWTRTALEEQRLRGLLGEPGGADPPAESVGEHLVATLAYDWPEAVQSLGPDDLGRWGSPSIRRWRTPAATSASRPSGTPPSARASSRFSRATLTTRPACSWSTASASWGSGAAPSLWCPTATHCSSRARTTRPAW